MQKKRDLFARPYGRGALLKKLGYTNEEVTKIMLLDEGGVLLTLDTRTLYVRNYVPTLRGRLRSHYAFFMITIRYDRWMTR